MAAASAGLLFLNGLGAIGGPLIVGRMMTMIGPNGYWIFIGTLMAALAGYTAWRMTRREARPAEETGSFAVIAPAAPTSPAVTGAPWPTKAESAINAAPPPHPASANQPHAAVPRGVAFRLHNMPAIETNQTSTDRSTCTTSSP